MKTHLSGDAIDALADLVRTGDLRSVARAISLVESDEDAAARLADRLYPGTGRALIVGLTGPPGAGKSTLVARLVSHYRLGGRRVGVVAVDPSSAFSGGALLGDRVRMQEHALDTGVFIRSMATRGHLGGLAAATVTAVDVLDAAGFDVVLVETVGVGQDEIEVAQLADVCVVVTVPGMGDEVQALKAGVMEIGDVFAVNKADRDGADRAVATLEQMLSLDGAEVQAPAPVVAVVATTGEGVERLAEAIQVRSMDEPRRQARRHQRAEWRIVKLIERMAVSTLLRRQGADVTWREQIERVASRARTPQTAAKQLVDASGHGTLDHVAIAATAIGESLALFADTLGLAVSPPEDVVSQGVRVRFVDAGPVRIELLEALDETSPFAQSLRRRGPGLHHIAVRVGDLEAALERLSAAGFRLIDSSGRPGAHGTTVAFVHPASTHGVLLELVEHGRG